MADNNDQEQQSVAVRERERPAIGSWPGDMERLMERFFGRAMRRGVDMWPWRGFGPMRPLMRGREEWLPDMDILEQEGKLVVRMDLPGMKREDIDVAIEGDMLVVSGQRSEEKETKEEDYYCSERSYGSFRRAIRLPEGATTDAIEATYKDGVLEMQIPRPTPPEPQKLKVEVK
jgi:HSP20 family protein